MNAAPAPSRRRPLALRPPALRIALAVIAGALLYGGFLWWAAHWHPAPNRWPIQGVAIGSANRPVSWPSLATKGASFAYIDAVTSGTHADANFTAEREAARAAGLRVGAIHHFALCTLASDQAGAFVRLVPREADALPPAVMLDVDAHCPHPPTRALLLSELTTFVNQLETHMGKAVIIAPSADFEARYQVADAINRTLWLRRNWRAPPEDGPPWVIWQANDALRVTGSTGSTRWLVLHNTGTDRQPEGAAG